MLANDADGAAQPNEVLANVVKVPSKPAQTVKDQPSHARVGEGNNPEKDGNHLFLKHG